MAGIPFAAIGAGLGLAAEAIQRQRAQQIALQDQLMRRQLQQAQLTALLDKDRRADEAANIALGALGLGGSPSTTSPLGLPSATVGGDMGGRAPFAPFPTPSVPSMPRAAMGGGAAVAPEGQPMEAPVPGLAWATGRPGYVPPADTLPAWTGPRPSTSAPESGTGALYAGPGAGGEPTFFDLNAVPMTDRKGRNIGYGPMPPPRWPNDRGRNAPLADVGRLADAAARGETQVAQAAGGGVPNIGTPPPVYDPATIAQAIRAQNPGISGRALFDAVELVGKQLGPNAKGAFDRWKALADIEFKKQELGQGQQRIGQGDVRLGIEGAAQQETGRHNVAVETETARRNRAGEQQRERQFETKLQQQQQKTNAAVIQMKTLADQARQLYAEVEANPSLVGTRGLVERAVGSVTEQAGVRQQREAATADFKSRILLLQAQLQKPLLGARYFSGNAQAQMNKLVPGLAAMDSPTDVKSALSALAANLENTAESTAAAAGAVQGDLSKMTDEQLLRGLGIQPAQE